MGVIIINTGMKTSESARKLLFRRMIMHTEKPGSASVQYDDLRGEAAADLSEGGGGLEKDLLKLGLNVPESIVGMSFYSGNEGDSFSVTFQVAEKETDVENLQMQLDKRGGVLSVKEYTTEKMSPTDFLRLFSRFQVSLFCSKGLPTAEEIKVLDNISLDED